MALQTLRRVVVLSELAVRTWSANRGVSETIGVLIMVLLTLVLAGILGLFVLKR